MNKVKLNIMAKFMNGEYCNIHPFTNNGTLINAGEKIRDIDAYIDKICDEKLNGIIRFF